VVDVFASVCSVAGQSKQVRDSQMSPIATWMPWLIAGSTFSTGLLFYLGMRRRVLPIARVAETSETRPLKIISAKWGIGGDAYEDVTEIICKRAKPDAVNLPVEKGLLGDPFPNAVKHLIVKYSYAREWSVTINESERLVLPEKPGEEQATVFMRDAKEKLAKLRESTKENDLILTMTDTEYRQYIQTDQQFSGLPWSHRITIRQIHKVGQYAAGHFRSILSRNGFSDPSRMVEDLKSYGFIEERQGFVRISPTIAKFIDAILDKHPIMD